MLPQQIKKLVIAFSVTILASQWALGIEPPGKSHLTKVTGIIKDSHDASVPSAAVLFETRIDGKKVKQKVKSNRDGLFEIELPAGTYQVIVKFSGFHEFKYKGLIVEGEKALIFDIVLKENPRKFTNITD